MPRIKRTIRVEPLPAAAPPEKEKDRYRTPRWLFRWASDVYGPFDVDLCADHDNHLAPYYYTRTNSCLLPEFDWRRCGSRGFCNPPFSDPGPFVYAAIEFARRGFSSFLVLPAHRNQRWAGEVGRWATEVLEPVGRVNYVLPDGSGVANGNLGGTIFAYFRAFDIGYPRRAHPVLASMEERYTA